MKHALKVATKPLNILNPYQKPLKAKISYYSYGKINFYHSLHGKKNAHLAGIMLDAATVALCPKLCRHNVPNPSGCMFFVNPVPELVAVAYKRCSLLEVLIIRL